jgi:hypothetical protein
MGIDDRIGWLLLGCILGFIAGYYTRTLQEIKEELDEVDAIVKEKRFSRRRSDRGDEKILRLPPNLVELERPNDEGFTRTPWIMNVALFIVVIMTLWAAVSSQHSSNTVKTTQAQIKQVTACNQVYLTKTIDALNERTTYTQAQADANVNLQKAQALFLNELLHRPPYSQRRQSRAAKNYLTTLTKFVTVSGQSSRKQTANPYPTKRALKRCLES